MSPANQVSPLDRWRDHWSFGSANRRHTTILHMIGCGETRSASARLVLNILNNTCVPMRPFTLAWKIEITELDIDGRLRRGGHRSLVLLSSVQFRCCEQVFNFSRMTKTSPETEITQNCCRPTASDNAHATDQCKSHKYLRCCLLHAMQLRLIFTDHFSDRGKAIGQVYVYVCVFG